MIDCFVVMLRGSVPFSAQVMPAEAQEKAINAMNLVGAVVPLPYPDLSIPLFFVPLQGVGSMFGCMSQDGVAVLFTPVPITTMADKNMSDPVCGKHVWHTRVSQNSIELISHP